MRKYLFKTLLGSVDADMTKVIFCRLILSYVTSLRGLLFNKMN